MRNNWPWKFALLLIALIIIPSLLLAYFSVQAIESERLAYEQRIRESYQRLAKYATEKLSDMVDDLAERWLETLRPPELLTAAEAQQHQTLESFIEAEPLVDAAYLITSTGLITYPPDRRPKHFAAFVPVVEHFSELDEWFREFRRLSEEAERWEFRRNNPEAAMAIFREIVERFPIPRLKAIALNEIARIYLYRAQWANAYQTYRQMIAEYPEARDLNNLHLRFYAKYQCVNALENLNQLDTAMSELLDLYQDLLDHSDEINRVQYEFFLERIQRRFRKLIVAFDETRQGEFRAAYRKLQEQKKKEIGTTYLVEKLYQSLSKGILKRSTYRDRFKFFSDFAVEQPYLVAYILLAENEDFTVKAALGLEMNLEELKQKIFPEIMDRGNFPEDVVIAILDEKRNFVLGDAQKIISEPAVLQPLKDPLDFWQLGLYPTLKNPLLSGGDQWLYAKLWGIFLLWLIIIVGAGLLLYNLRKQQQLSLQKTTFISSITHELKTPLTSIKMFSDILGRHPALQNDAEARKCLDILQAESNRLSQLVDNVLDFAKMERGVRQYHYEYEEPEAILRQVVDTLRYQTELHGVPIELNLEPGLPELYVDRQAISQALINLITNAIKYSPEKKPVKIAATCNGQYLHISIQDQGIGIPKKHLQRIFDDYFRVTDNSAANIAGTGLGLPLVKRIAKAHKGEITVTSEYGKGSTFTLKLPLPEN